MDARMEQLSDAAEQAEELIELIPMLERLFLCSVESIYLSSSTGRGQILKFTKLLSILSRITEKKRQSYEKRISFLRRKLQNRNTTERAANSFSVNRRRRMRSPSSSPPSDSESERSPSPEAPAFSYYSHDQFFKNDNLPFPRSGPPPKYNPKLPPRETTRSGPPPRYNLAPLATTRERSVARTTRERSVARPRRRTPVRSPPIAARPKPSQKRRIREESPQSDRMHPTLPTEPVGHDHIGPLFDYSDYLAQYDAENTRPRLRGGGFEAMGAGHRAQLQQLEEDSDASDDDALTANAWHTSDPPSVSNSNSSSHRSRSYAPGLNLPKQNEQARNALPTYSHARVVPDASSSQWTAIDPKDKDQTFEQNDADENALKSEMSNPLAATFGTSSLMTEGGYYSASLEAKGVPREVMAQFKDNLYEEKGQMKIVNHLNGNDSIEVTLKGPDKRLRYLDDDGNTTRPDLNQVSKRLKQGHKEMVKERNTQIQQAHRDLQLWTSLPAEEKLKRLKARRQPIKFMNNDPGFVAQEDITEAEEVPSRYVRKARTRSYGSSNARRNYMPVPHRQTSGESISETGPLDHFEEFNNDIFDTPPPRTDDEIEQLVAELVIGTATTPSLNSRSTIRATGKRTPDLWPNSDRVASSSSSSESGLDLETFDDSPELDIRTLQTFESERVVGSPDLGLEEEVDELMAQSAKFGRAVTVRLSKGVVFTPGAFKDRVFNGVIQSFQFFPRDNTAICIFLTPTAAESFLRHNKKVSQRIRALEDESRNPSNNYQPSRTKEKRVVGTQRPEYHEFKTEFRRLQFDHVEWYKGNQLKAIVPGQSGVVRAAIYDNATRVLRLHKLGTKKPADLERALGYRLQILIVAVCLLLPSQRYKQKEIGWEAIVEFSSIDDAVNARAKLPEYEPDFAEDPCNGRTHKMWWCNCTGCE